MFLLRLITKYHDLVKIVPDRDQAIAEAKTWVGEHNEVDGCSTRPVMTTYASHLVVHRETSFGRRAAYIFAATANEPLTFNMANVRTR